MNKIREMEGRHQQEVDELKRKVKFLINKIESQEETVSKPSLGALSSISDMIQSKMVHSNTSTDSFQVAPASLTVKDNLTRRNTSGAKTPSKYSVTHRGKHPLGDRN